MRDGSEISIRTNVITLSNKTVPSASSNLSIVLAVQGALGTAPTASDRGALQSISLEHYDPG